MDLNTSIGTYFPVQKLSYSKKDLDWRHKCVDSVITITFSENNRRSTRANKQRNYDLFNNKIDQSIFKSATNPLNLNSQDLKDYNFPTNVQAYDILSPYFHLLLGEESKRSFNPIVIATNEDSLSEKQNLKKEEIMKVLQGMLMSDDQEEEQDPDKDDDQKILEKFQNYTPKMLRERNANHVLKHYLKKANTSKLFNDCFKDALNAGEEIASIEKVGRGVQVRRVNPLELDFTLENNSDTIDSSEKIHEGSFSTISQVIDDFYEYLTEDQIQELESIQRGEMSPSLYGSNVFSIGETDSIFSFQNQNTNGIAVHRVRWKSKKKMGIHHFLDQDEIEQEEIVEETFKVNKEDKSSWVEWFWVNEYWEGVRLGADMYLDPLIRPRKQQFRSMDNLSECKSGYVGNIYSCTNSQSVSLMDRLYPWWYMYLVTWYRVEVALGKYQGKLAFIDTSLIPTSWDPEKWMHYAQAMGFAFVNTYNEENKSLGIAGGANMSQQNKAIDLETSAYIIQHLTLLQHIDERIQNTAGITRQRLGSITSSELVGNTERAVTQSSHITEPYFFLHENFKLRVCDAIVEAAKDCYEGKNSSLQYISDDLQEILCEIDGDDYINADYDVFCSNSSKDMKSLEDIKMLLQAALQNDKIMLSEALNVLTSDSIPDIKASLFKAEKEMIARSQQAEQQKMQQEGQIAQQNMQIQKEAMDRDDYNKEQDRVVKIQVAEIGAEASAANKAGADLDQDGTPDFMETAQLALEERKHQGQMSLEEKKLSLEKEKLNAENKRTESDAKMKTKELEAKERIEKFKVRHKPKPKSK